MCIRALVTSVEMSVNNAGVSPNVGLVLKFFNKEDEEALLEWQRLGGKEYSPLVVVKVSENP